MVGREWRSRLEDRLPPCNQQHENKPGHEAQQAKRGHAMAAVPHRMGVQAEKEGTAVWKEA